jgi:cell division protein FtsB
MDRAFDIAFGKRRRPLIWGACAVAGVLALCSVLDAKGFRRSRALRQDIASLQQRNEVLREENAELADRIRGLRKSPEAQERAAREELGFVKPGEIVINLE